MVPEVDPLTANAGQDAGAAPAPEATPGATPDPSTGAPDPNAEPANTGEPGAEPAGDAPGAEEPRVKLSELTAQRKRRIDAEKTASEKAAEAAYWRGRAESVAPTAPAPTAPQAAPKEPTLDDFEGPTAYEDWIAARTEFRIEQKQGQRQAQETQQAQVVSVEQKFGERIQAASADIPDLAETINTARLPRFDDSLVAAIKKSADGPQLVYFLAKNPGEAERFAKMDPTDAIMELGAMREKVRASLKPKTKTATTAPPPISHVNGNGAMTTTDIADLPMAEYAKAREEQTFVKVGGRMVRR